MRISQNIPALQAHNSMLQANARISKAANRLSTGAAIIRSKDNPSGMAISNRMRAQITGLETASGNSMDGINIIQTADGALNEIHAMIQRMRELAIKSANDTNEPEDREKIQMEIDQLVREIDAVADKAQFNTKHLFGTKNSLATLAGIFDSSGNITGAVRITSKDPSFPAGDVQFDISSGPVYAEHNLSFNHPDSFPLATDAVFTVDGIEIELKAGEDWDTVFNRIKGVLQNNDMIVSNPQDYDLVIYAKYEIFSITLDTQPIATSQPKGASQINLDITDLFKGGQPLSTDVYLQIGDLEILLPANTTLAGAETIIKTAVEGAGMTLRPYTAWTGVFSILTTDESITEASFRMSAVSITNPGAAEYTVDFDASMFTSGSLNTSITVNIGGQEISFPAGTTWAAIDLAIDSLVSSNFPGATYTPGAAPPYGFTVRANGINDISVKCTDPMSRIRNTSTAKQAYQLDLRGLDYPISAGEVVLTIGTLNIDLGAAIDAASATTAAKAAINTSALNSLSGFKLVDDGNGVITIYTDPREMGKASLSGAKSAGASVYALQSPTEYTLNFTPPLPTSTPMTLRLRDGLGSIQIPAGATAATIAGLLDTQLGGQCTAYVNGSGEVVLLSDRELERIQLSAWNPVSVVKDTDFEGRNITFNGQLPLSYDMILTIGGIDISLAPGDTLTLIANKIRAQFPTMTVVEDPTNDTLSLFSSDHISPVSAVVVADIMDTPPHQVIRGFDIDFTKHAIPLASNTEMTIDINGTIVTVKLAEGDNFAAIQTKIQAAIDGAKGPNNYTVGYGGEGKFTIYPAAGQDDVDSISFDTKDILSYPGYNLQFDQSQFPAPDPLATPPFAGGFVGTSPETITFTIYNSVTDTTTTQTITINPGDQWSTFYGNIMGIGGGITAVDDGNGKFSFTATPPADIVDVTSSGPILSMEGGNGVRTSDYTDAGIANLTFTEEDGTVHTLVLGTDYEIIDGKVVITWQGSTMEVEIPVYYDENYYAQGFGEFVLGDGTKINGMGPYQINIELRNQDYGQFVVQIGANKDERMDIEMPEVNATVLGLDALNYIGAITTTTDPLGNVVTTYDTSTIQDAINACDAAVNMVSQFRATLASYQNRLEYTVTGLDTMAITMEEALSRLADTDMAKEMITYTSQSVIYQSAMSILAQANQRPQQILQLLSR